MSDKFIITNTERSVTWTLSESAFRRVMDVFEYSDDIKGDSEEYRLALNIIDTLNSSS